MILEEEAIALISCFFVREEGMVGGRGMKKLFSKVCLFDGSAEVVADLIGQGRAEVRGDVGELSERALSRFTAKGMSKDVAMLSLVRGKEIATSSANARFLGLGILSPGEVMSTVDRVLDELESVKYGRDLLSLEGKWQKVRIQWHREGDLKMTDRVASSDLNESWWTCADPTARSDLVLDLELPYVLMTGGRDVIMDR